MSDPFFPFFDVIEYAFRNRTRFVMKLTSFRNCLPCITPTLVIHLQWDGCSPKTLSFFALHGPFFDEVAEILSKAIRFASETRLVSISGRISVLQVGNKKLKSRNSLLIFRAYDTLTYPTVTYLHLNYLTYLNLTYLNLTYL